MRITSGRENMSRRSFLRFSAACTASAILPSFGSYRQNARAGEAKAMRPNIVFVLADDLGWADVGYHGSKVRTPNIDRLSSQGVRFNHHYVMATCTPTRVGLMTGHYPSRYGVLSPAYGKIFNDDTVTLAMAMRQAGYSTSISGKWHMGSPPEYTPLKYGFDTSYGYFAGQVDPYTHYYKTGARTWHRNDEYLDEEGHATDLITNEAVRIIESDHTKPFFLYVAYSVPHHPLDEPDEWTSKYDGQFEAISRSWYAASVTHMDQGIGRIIEALERKGLRENTLIVFSSDNGGQKNWISAKEYKGRYADKPHTVLGDNLPLRGWKGELHEGGIRVPAFANWPGVLKPGQVDVPMHIVDWMPTLCNLVGWSSKRNLNWDGRDIWPYVSGKESKAQPRAMYWKTPNASAVRLGDWKLIAPKKGDGVELFNLVADPYEKKDLVGEQPEKVRELKSLLASIAKDDR